MAKILSINAGSSSLKFQMFDMPSARVITKGIIERIGLNDSMFTIEIKEEKTKLVRDIENHTQAVVALLEALVNYNVVTNFEEIDGIAHRVVHGGEKFKDSVIINDEIIEDIRKLSDLAPLHNPVNLIGIEAFRKVLPNTVAVAVFDTSFHQTMEPEAYIYPLPYEWYEKFGIRRYGFHGTSHKYVSRRAAKMLDKQPEEINVISAHIGNGVSLCAVKGGKSVDTTMGMTPLAGIAMGTRSGDIDPAIIEFISEKQGKSIHEVIKNLNSDSGLLGISGVSSDGRDIRKGIEEGNERCLLAFRVQVKRIGYFVAAYHAYMDGTDALIFTAGVGENDAKFRKAICDGLKVLGIEVDNDLNENKKGERIISTPESMIKVMVIPTNEELMMAEDVYRLKK